jgi:hypothetical protein
MVIPREGPEGWVALHALSEGCLTTSCRGANRQDPELLGPAARQLNLDLVTRQVPDHGSADRGASRNRIALPRLVVADQPMLTNGPRRKILDLDSSANGSRLVPGRLLPNHSRRIQQPLKTREPRRQDGLLLEGLQVVIVATDLAKPARLIEAVRELDVKLMPQTVKARLQRPRTLAGDDGWRWDLGLDL